MLVQVQQKPGDTPEKTPAKKPAAKPAAKDAAKSGGITVLPGGIQDANLSPTAQLGRVRFNDQCSHCHGADGASPIRERDIRRLKMRYDAKWKETAVTTIKNGRADAGMPPWKDILKDPEIEQLLSFIDTLQK
jgi:mono/diheme cytochrome c family protein